MKKMFTLSFDDGTVQDRRFVGLLNKYGIKCTFNLNSGLFGTVHDINHNNIICNHDEISADEVKELYRGHEVAVHTVTHPNLLQCDDERAHREIGDDKNALEALSGQKITGMAYPGGPFYDDRIKAIANSHGLFWARNVRSTWAFDIPADFMEWCPTCWIEDAGLFIYAEQFINAPADRDMIFYVWGHSFEFDKYRSWEKLEKFLQYMSGREGIEYMTNGQIYAYITDGK